MEARKYNEQLAMRLLYLIEKEEFPENAMDELARAAERGGLILDCNVPRQLSPTQFLMDLLITNPAAGDWMRARLETMPHPLKMHEISEIAELLL